MKKRTSKQMHCLLLLVFALSCIACVNLIGDDIQQSDTPISFATKMSKESTRVTGNLFDVGDQIGLFATLTTATIDQQRYIDNLRLECGESSTLIPQKEVFYPEGDTKLNFISYYPYQADGIPQETTLLNITVQSDQSKTQNYSLSNFMTARTENVANSKEAVELEYKHQFAKIKIVLVPKEGENADDMLKANPRIIATGFKTQAIYDLKADKLSGLIDESETDIIPFGKWKKESNGTLSGKEFIVIPQTHSHSEQAFTLEWNGKIYACSVSPATIKEDTELEIRIDALQSTSKALTGVVASIREWSNAEAGTSENTYDITTIHTASFSFASSDVYRIYNQGKPVAEVCREYLRSANKSIDTKAITVYPVSDNERTDFTNGLVLRLPDKTVATHGGKVSWNTQTNSLTYTPGNSKPIDKFYIDANRHITLEPSATSLSVNVSSYSIRDIRNGVLQTYPIVKIGTQYWMKEDLQPTYYNDNTKIPKMTILVSGDAYYEKTDYNLRLYNGEVILTQKIAPHEWKIPSESDWVKLKTYVGENAATTKSSGAWKPLEDEIAFPATNETGLSIYPNGFLLERKGSSVLINHNSSVAYWVYDGMQTQLNKIVTLTKSNNDIAFKESVKVEGKDYYNAFSIRCIKE